VTALRFLIFTYITSIAGFMWCSGDEFWRHS